jgi:hypothetical protein
MKNPLIQQQLDTVTDLRKKLDREEEALLTLMRLFKHLESDLEVNLNNKEASYNYCTPN